MRGTCRPASATALLARVDDVSRLEQFIESAPDDCEPEDPLNNDAIALHTLVVDFSDPFLAQRVFAFALIVADLLDLAIQFQDPLATDAAGALFVASCSGQ